MAEGVISEAWKARQRGVGRVNVRATWDNCAEVGQVLNIDGYEFGKILLRRDFPPCPPLSGSRVYQVEMSEEIYGRLNQAGFDLDTLMYREMIGRIS